MTQNQIAYHNARELERHNRMTEAEQNRHQLADEAIRARANAIQATMNYVQAVHYRNQDTENKRSNLAHEYLTSQQLMETSRHNRATERITESLNQSLIKKNLAEASYTTQNTAYIREKTKEAAYNAESAKIGVLLTDAQRVETLNRARAVNAETSLKNEQAAIQWTIGLRNFTSSVYDVARTVDSVVGTTGNVFRSLFGDQGMSTMQQQNNTAIEQYNSGSTGSDLGDYFSGGVDVETFTGNPNYYQ